MNFEFYKKSHRADKNSKSLYSSRAKYIRIGARITRKPLRPIQEEQGNKGYIYIYIYLPLSPRTGKIIKRSP